MNSNMPKPHLPYLQREKTRHGVTAWYVRLNRQSPRIRIHGLYGSEQFMAEYQAAIAGTPVLKKSLVAHKGSLRWLVDQWRESSDWHMTAASTKRQRDNILAHILDANGTLPFAQVDESAITAGRERRMKTPFAANNYLKTMRGLFGWAKEMKMIAHNPAAKVKMLSRKTDGHEPWTEQDVEAYRKRWPVGTRARVAMEVLYWTMLRRGDAVRLGKQHIGSDGLARIKTEKNGKLAVVKIPEYFLEILKSGPVGDLTFIVSTKNTPYKKESFGTIFRKWCRDAGISKSPHGFRKTGATEIADGGGSEMEIQNSLSHASGAESAVYTRTARQTALAIRAMEIRTKNNSIPAPFSEIPAPKNNKGKSNA